MVEDHELVDRLLRGDEAAFGCLWGDYYPRVLRFTTRLLHGDQDTAEDITQDVFEHVLEKLDQFEFRSRLSSWMMKIAYFKAIKLHHREGRKSSFITSDAEGNEVDLGQIVPSTAPGPLREAEWKQALARYQEAVDRLDPDERGVWIMRKEEGLSYEAMSEVLEESANALRIRISRIRKRLLEKMGKEYLVDLQYK